MIVSSWSPKIGNFFQKNSQNYSSSHKGKKKTRISPKNSPKVLFWLKKMTKFVEIKINDCKAEWVVGGTLNIGLLHKESIVCS
jgi:hypothetical protein